MQQISSVSSTHTNFEGQFSFSCPTQQCLIYSFGRAGFSNNYWLEIVESGTNADLSGSKAIQSYHSRY